MGAHHPRPQPSNIMLTQEGFVKVMDFGIARAAKEAMTQAMTNTVVGTAVHGPEQEQGRGAAESDVYALAVCFYDVVRPVAVWRPGGYAHEQD